MIRINRQPSGTQLAVFAAAWTAMAGLLAWKLGRHGHDSLAWVAAGAAAAVPVAGGINRGWLRAVYLGAAYATYPLGFVLSYLILAVAFAGVITPVGLLLRLFGRDPLRRRFERSRVSYWQPRPAPPPPESYFRQS